MFVSTLLDSGNFNASSTVTVSGSYFLLNSSYPSTSSGSKPSLVLSTSSLALREYSSNASCSSFSLCLNVSNCFSFSACS